MSPRRGGRPPRTAAPRTTAEQDTGDIARGAGVNYLGYVARLGSRVPFLFLAGLLYGETAFGVYTFGITIVETAAAVSLFGMKRSLFKLMSDEAAETGSAYGAMTHGIVFALAAGSVAMVAIAAGAGPLAGLFRLPEAAAALVIFAPAVLFIVISDILLVTIRFTRQMRFEVYARSLAEPATLTVATVALHLLGAGRNGLAAAYTISLAVAAGMTAWFFVRIFSVRRCVRTRLEAREMRRLVAFSGPTAVYDFLLMLGDKVDVLLVSYFLPSASVGVYGMARQFATATKKIRAGFDRILPPVLSDSIAAGDRERAERHVIVVARWILVVATAVFLFFAFHAGRILGLLEGAFATGAVALVLLMAADAVNGTLGVAEFPVVFLRPRANVAIGALMLAAGVGLGALLIPRFGLAGAGGAVALTALVTNAARVETSRRLLGLRILDVSLLKPLAAAVPAAAAVWVVRPLVPRLLGLDIVAGAVTILIVYLAALRLLGLEPEDRAQMERVRGALRRAARPGR
ncbi:MAG: oligosaccharide flippase family protein [Gemmatimonadota bacterium]|nr:oligosaccharide flippase family protein [Gemmatimonadota bacterium]